MKEFLISLLNFLGLACWIEIVTEKPSCTYYFGPFISPSEAKAALSGYIEDLEQEGTQGIKVDIKRCRPINLTIFDDLGEMASRGGSVIFSGQM